MRRPAWLCLARPPALAALVCLTGVNLAGIRKTALTTRLIATFVLAVLAVVQPPAPPLRIR